MIEREEMLTLLRQVDPRFDEAASAFLTEWENDPIAEKDGLPHYLYISELTPLIAQDIKDSKADTLRYVFQLIDRLVVEGDHYVSEVAVIGLLEGIQNQLIALKIPLSQAHPYLLRQSRQYWDDLIEFWKRI